MMKKYYILSKNTTVESYQSIFNGFELKDIEIVSYDRALDHVFVSGIISENDSLFLLIPTILDPFNAYSYDGVEYALKYYFHFVSIKKGDFQIILLGTEEESAFWRHCEYSSILKCPHVSYLKNNIYPIQDCLARIESVPLDMDWACCIERLKQLNIKKPASYKTHHSITNEWCIYRWSKYLGMDDIDIQKDIEDFLYFNYLKAVYPEAKVDDPKSFLISEKGKILLIDDEVGKGWHTFFKSFLRFSPSVTFDSIGANFKNLTPQDIINQTETKIKDFSPDLVLLDLRLHDDDFGNKAPIELTGAKVFELIKTINKGIQIVIFSASNKVWNYLPFASDGIILKESPENSVKKNYTTDCISNLITTMESRLKKRHLKNFYSKIKGIEAHLSHSNCFENLDEIIGNLETAFELLTKASEDSEYFAYSYLQLFLVLEKYVNLTSIFDETETDFYLNHGSERYCLLKDKINSNSKNYKWKSVISYEGGHYCLGENIFEGRYVDTNFRVSAVLLFKFGENTSGVFNWTNIYTIRNTKAAHPKSEKPIAVGEMDQLLDFMMLFFDESKARWRPIEDAFPERSIEEGVALLQEKFGNSPQY